VIARENVIKRGGLMAELEEERRKQGTRILLPLIFEIKEEVGQMS
jgi:hypothetical protein